MAHAVAQGWSLGAAIRPCIAISSASAYALYTFSAPSKYTARNTTIIFILSATFLRRFNDLLPDDQLNSIFAHGVLIWLIHIAHVALIRRNDGLTAATNPASKVNLSPFYQAYKMLYNYRGINTSWQVVKTPQTPSTPSSLSSARTDFLPRQLFTIFIRYLALALFYEVSELLNSSPTYLSQMHTAARTYLTLNFVLHNYLLLSSLHELLSILFIYVLRLDEPHEWPPLYGDIREAYTVRRFWSYFWHRLVYAPFRAVADEMSDRVWGKGEYGRRMVNVCLVFLLSGAIHSVIDWKRGWCNCWGSGWFYVIQPLAFAMESVVQGVWAPVRRRCFVPGSRRVVTFESILGYVWVWTWFLWLYPQRTVWEVSCLRARVSVSS